MGSGSVLLTHLPSNLLPTEVLLPKRRRRTLETSVYSSFFCAQFHGVGILTIVDAIKTSNATTVVNGILFGIVNGVRFTFPGAFSTGGAFLHIEAYPENCKF